MPVASAVISRGKCLLAFVVSFAAAAALLTRTGGFPEVPELSAKHDRWSAARDEFDTIFVGSSRTFHHIDPESFADAVAEAGLARPRGYNVGANLMFPPESFRWLRELLAAKPKRLKWVVLEFVGIRGKGEFGEGFETSARGAWWHDARHTRLAVEHVWADDRLPFLEKAGETCEHLTLFVRVVSGTGLAGEKISRQLLPPADEKPLGFDLATGFSAYADQNMPPADTEGYRKQLADRLVAPPPALRSIPADLRSELKVLVKEVRAAGAELVLIEPPAGIPLSRPMKPLPDVLHLGYTAVEKNTRWYQPDTRRDGGHLKGTAAKEFSRQLGTDFAAMIKQQAADKR